MRSTAAGLLMTLCLGMGGCALLTGAGVATAGVIWLNGEAKKIYPVTLDAAFEASVRTMNNMGLSMLEQKRSGEGWYLRSRRPTDAEEVKITIQSSSQNSTEVKVRVGVTGDRAYSERLLTAVGEQLQGS